MRLINNHSFEKSAQLLRIALFSFAKIWIDFCPAIMYNCLCIVKNITKVNVD